MSDDEALAIFGVYRVGGGLLAEGTEKHPYDEQQAESRCRKANDDAERLGIEARYEIRHQEEANA